MIGVFDSGFGGLTILKELKKVLPEYDFMYLGDNARAPYGSRSFESIFKYTVESVKTLFDRGCPLVILACNTASARALRSIQQQILPKEFPNNRVLGIIRPTAEEMGHFSKTGHIGILATPGTVLSGSYLLEIKRFFPDLKVTQHACPMWVPLVECGEIHTEGSRYFVKKEVNNLLTKDPKIDSILLACTHYPLLEEKIREVLPPHVRLIFQGNLVAQKTLDYLNRHKEIDNRLTKGGKIKFLTSDTAEFFEKGAYLFGITDISAESLTF